MATDNLLITIAGSSITLLITFSLYFIRQIANILDKHETRLDKHEESISTIITTHNNSACGVKAKIEASTF